MPYRAQRLSVLAQTIELIRDGILSGRWKDALPQERLLCEQLNVSRSTLRRALPKIQSLGLIEDGQRGVRRKIILPNGSQHVPHSEKSDKARIIWLTRDEIDTLPNIIKTLYIELQKRLEQQSCELRILTIPHKPFNEPEKYLAEWLGEQSASAWILHSMPDKVQVWFSNKQVPAFIFGNKAPNIELGAINIDNGPAITHAVHSLRKLKHSHLGLLRSSEDLVGENNSEKSFLDALEANETPYILNASSHNDELHTLFSRVYSKAKKASPTALICTLPHFALFAMTWLAKHKIDVPQHVSIVLLRPAETSDYIYPPISHYKVSEHTIVPAALPALMDLVHTQVSPQREISLVPEFYHGQTIAKAPRLQDGTCVKK
ncbi:substrate-binding domain-containing protein [Rubritalea tangerina]|uniref:Substrate-binding domain-containing protein n=1 Tax=Rubritalea tangerina TaxID=430798 RepID=A0ABW4Z9Y6_9BACT